MHAGFDFKPGGGHIIPEINCVFTTGEKLYDFQRKKIKDVFACDVLDGYGARDGGVQTFECEEHRGYHIGIETVVLEVIENGSDSNGSE